MDWPTTWGCSWGQAKIRLKDRTARPPSTSRLDNNTENDMKFEILNRFTGSVQFTAEIDCSEDAPTSIKIGLAVKFGLESEADLCEADLCGADLRWANLRGANLCEADLCGANLDFSSWPLHCGSTRAKAGDRLVAQLLFHATRLDVSECSGGVREAVDFLRQMAVCNLFPEYRTDTEKCVEFAGE